MSQGKVDARRQFEESLQRVTKVQRAGNVDVQAPELLHLLLTPTPVRAADGASVRAPADVDDRKNAASSDKHRPASLVGDDSASVFTSNKLDEYLATDVLNDNCTVDASDVQELAAEWNSSMDRCTREVQDSVRSLSSGKETKDSADASQKSANECRSQVEFDIIDGFSFYSFWTPDALKQYLDASNLVTAKTDVAECGRTKKFQYGIAGNMAKYLPKMKGWDKRASTTTAADDDGLDALLSDGMLRQVSDAETPGLSLTDDGNDDEDASMQAGPVRQVRRAVDIKMGDEERQPRKGWIYGRKYGRFASKANIHYFIKRRRCHTADTESSPSYNVTSSGNTRASVASSQSLTNLQNFSRLVSTNLQPRVDLTKSIISLPKTRVTKEDDALSSKVKAVSRSTSAVHVRTTERLHLLRLTDSTARRAVVALQLAPSMTNSPLKCSQPGMMINSF